VDYAEQLGRFLKIIEESPFFPCSTRHNQSACRNACGFSSEAYYGLIAHKFLVIKSTLLIQLPRYFVIVFSNPDRLSVAPAVNPKSKKGRTFMEWPGNAIATIKFQASRVGPPRPGLTSPTLISPGNVNILLNNAFSTQQEVQDPQITFKVKCEHTNTNGAGITARAMFRVTLQRCDGTQFTLIDSQTQVLGGVAGSYSAEIAVSVTMQDPSAGEQYLITFHAEELGGELSSFPGDTWAPLAVGTLITASVPVYYQAVMDEYLADFTFDFIPITIVYCPPGKDMTASLLQSLTFGTRLGVGTASGMQSTDSYNFTDSLFGILSLGFVTSTSWSVSTKSTSGIQLSGTRQTQITADN
jgi:hypothetical protein